MFVVVNRFPAPFRWTWHHVCTFFSVRNSQSNGEKISGKKCHPILCPKKLPLKINTWFMWLYSNGFCKLYYIIHNTFLNIVLPHIHMMWGSMVHAQYTQHQSCRHRTTRNDHPPANGQINRGLKLIPCDNMGRSDSMWYYHSKFCDKFFKTN